MIYGSKKPNVHTMPTAYHSKSSGFTEVSFPGCQVLYLDPSLTSSCFSAFGKDGHVQKPELEHHSSQEQSHRLLNLNDQHLFRLLTNGRTDTGRGGVSFYSGLFNLLVCAFRRIFGILFAASHSSSFRSLFFALNVFHSHNKIELTNKKRNGREKESLNLVAWPYILGKRLDLAHFHEYTLPSNT